MLKNNESFDELTKEDLISSLFLFMKAFTFLMEDGLGICVSLNDPDDKFFLINDNGTPDIYEEKDIKMNKIEGIENPDIKEGDYIKKGSLDNNEDLNLN